jgi:hypothetical protein
MYLVDFGICTPRKEVRLSSEWPLSNELTIQKYGRNKSKNKI